jgi:hypothetical protein
LFGRFDRGGDDPRRHDAFSIVRQHDRLGQPDGGFHLIDQR